MKFCQLCFFDPAYLRQFYAQRPNLENASFSERQGSLMQDGFSAVHYFAEGMPALGYESLFIVGNDHGTQAAWQRENAPNLDLRRRMPQPPGAYGHFLPDDLLAIAIAQINRFDPDVLYLQDAVGTDTRFLDMLAKRPRLVVGWRAAHIPKGCDWSGIDVMVSNHTPSLEAGKRNGARWQEWLHPGFPRRIAESVGGLDKNLDVSFAGGVSCEHTRRINTLIEVAMAQMTGSRDFSLAYYVDPEPRLPGGICMHAKGKVWGLEMYECLRKTRVNLNVHIDLAGNEAANMRLFETTGIGSFLLTDAKKNMASYFEPGSEIEVFESIPDLLEKIDFYLANEKAREAIAAAGQRACLDRFSLDVSCRNLDDIIRRALRAKGTQRFPGLHKLRGRFRKGPLAIPVTP